VTTNGFLMPQTPGYYEIMVESIHLDDVLEISYPKLLLSAPDITDFPAATAGVPYGLVY